MAVILIAEDEKNLQLLMQERLKAYYTILIASDGAEAMEILWDKHVDLLITDVMMPGMDGFQLLKSIRQDGMKLPVLILTAKHSFTDKQTGFSFGTDDESSYTISRDNLRIDLPPKEFELVYKLLSYPDVIFTKNQLLDEIWGYDSDSSEYTIRTHVSRLRNRLTGFDEFQIITIKGLGYKGIITENKKKRR